MKDPYAVLRQKEDDVERLRKEIQTLLAIIPLISDEPLAPGTHPVPTVTFDHQPADFTDNSMVELQRYYPFIKHPKN